MPKRKLSLGLDLQHDPGDDQSDSPIEEKIIKTEPVDRYGDSGVAFEEILVKTESYDVPDTPGGEVSTFRNLGGVSLHPNLEVDQCISVKCEQQCVDVEQDEDPLPGDGESTSLKILDYSSLCSKIVIVNPQDEPEEDQSGCRDPLLDEEAIDAGEPFDQCGGSGVTLELKRSKLESDDSLGATSSTSTTGKRRGVSCRDKLVEATYKRLARKSKHDELKTNFASKVERVKEAKELETGVLPVIEKVYSRNELGTMNGRKGNWTDVEIIRALTLRSQSTRAYSYLRKTKKIPGKSRLKRWARATIVSNGILHNVVSLMKFVSKDLSLEEKICVLSIDEVLVSKSFEYDEIVDEIIGPFSNMQVVLAKSLVGSWIQPVFVDFDTEVTKCTLVSITSALYDAGYVVVCCVNDCSDKSLRLWKELGASMDEPHFPHPSTGEPIVCMCDAPTLLRTLRDQLLRKGFRLNGHQIDREPLDALVCLVESDKEICPKLTELHIRRNSSTTLAIQLFSNSVAKALSLYTPGRSEVKAKNTSNLINVLNSWIDLMTVKSDDPVSEQTGSFKSPYGLHLDDQNQLLANLCSMMKTVKTRNGVVLPFRVGIVMSCTALPILLKTSLRYGIKSILTRNVNLVWIKNLVTPANAVGSITTPLLAIKRLREISFDKISLHHSEWDPTPTPYFLFSSAFRKASLDPKEILDNSGNGPNALMQSNFDFVIPPFLDKPDLPLSVLNLMAIAVAVHFKNKCSNLCKPYGDVVVRTWSSGTDVPTDYFLGCVVKMEKLFLNYIKKNDLVRAPGLARILSKRIKSCLKLSLPIKLICCFVKLRLSIHAKYYLRQQINQEMAQLDMRRLIKFNFLKALKKTEENL